MSSPIFLIDRVILSCYLLNWDRYYAKCCSHTGMGCVNNAPLAWCVSVCVGGGGEGEGGAYVYIWIYIYIYLFSIFCGSPKKGLCNNV